MPAPRRKVEQQGPVAPQIRVMIVDDHPIWRSTLRQLLEHTPCEVVAEASDGRGAIAAAESIRPDVVVMDLALPGMGGIEATRALTHAIPDSKVLVLSSSDEPHDVVDAVNAGASGYLVKTLGPDEVADAITRIHRGELVFPPELSGVVLEEFRRLSTEGPPPPPPRLVVADGVALAREGLARLLEEAGCDVVGIAGTPAALVKLLAADLPDVVVVDVRLASARPDGRTTIVQQIRSRFPDLAILVLSGEADGAEAARMIEEGQRRTGYVLRDRIEDVAELRDVIGRVAAGELVVDPRVVNRIAADGAGPRHDLRHLTEREREVLALMAEGRSNQAIGEQLFLGLKTVEAHVHRIFMKLGLDQTAGDHRRVLAVITYLRAT